MTRAIFLTVFMLVYSTTYSQVVLHTDSLVAEEYPETSLCYNNSSAMAGNSVGDRYFTWFNSDTIFLAVKESGVWTRKTAHLGTGILLATLTLHNDTIWLFWKEGGSVRTCYSTNKGDSWGSVAILSSSGNASAPAIYAASNGNIHFVWFNERTADTIVQHTVYANGSFLPSPNTLSTPGFKASWPCVTAVGDTVVCSWKETHGNSKIYAAHSFSGGAAGSWTSAAVNNAANTGKDPSLSWAMDGSTGTHFIYLVYDGNQQIYLQRSADGGATWTTSAVISNPAKNSQFAKVESANEGFVGVSWEHRTVVSLFDDTKKDVGFAYSTDWADAGSFGNDSLAYTRNPFGAPLASLSRIDDYNFYLTWLSRDTVTDRNLIYERRIQLEELTQTPYFRQDAIRLYPNPVSGTLTLELQHPGIVAIVDVSGKPVVEKIVASSSETLDVSNLRPGVYFLRMEGSAGSHKVIVQ